jgi:uncharacterized coiled-coil protein SlyX
MSEENRLNKIESRVKNVEEAILLLNELVIRSDERMNTFDVAFNNLTVKLDTLADAQIRTENALGRLAEAQSHYFNDDKRNDKP